MVIGPSVAIYAQGIWGFGIGVAEEPKPQDSPQGGIAGVSRRIHDWASTMETGAVGRVRRSRILSDKTTDAQATRIVCAGDKVDARVQRQLFFPLAGKNNRRHTCACRS